MTTMWFVLFIALLLIELATINLITIWFSLGALAAFITSFITNNVVIQVVVFIIVSIISLLLTKKVVKKIRTRKIIPTNLDRVVGKIGIVTKDVTENSHGEVKVEGNIWTAISKEEIKKDSQVKVLKIEGVKLIVEKKEEEK